MAKKVKIIGAKPKRIRVKDKPQRRIKPTEIARALGASDLLGPTDKKTCHS